jgi:hypothetical protein
MANFDLEKEILSVFVDSKEELKAQDIHRKLKSKVAPRTLNTSLKHLKDQDRIISIDQASKMRYTLKNTLRLYQRFDKLGSYRYGKNNFASFMGLTSDTKYNTSSEKMFKRIAKEIISPAERLGLLKHYVYSMMISHEAKAIAKKFKVEFPKYILELKKLGSLKYYKMKQIKKVGKENEWVSYGEPLELVEVLEKYHHNRVQKLHELGWIK